MQMLPALQCKYANVNVEAFATAVIHYPVCMSAMKEKKFDPAILLP